MEQLGGSLDCCANYANLVCYSSVIQAFDITYSKANHLIFNQHRSSYQCINLVYADDIFVTGNVQVGIEC